MRMPVIVISAGDDAETREQARRLGAAAACAATAAARGMIKQ